MPIVGQSISNNAAILYEHNYFRDQFAYDDPKEIVQNAVKLLDEPEKRKALSESNAEIFDRAFEPEMIINDVLARLKS